MTAQITVVNSEADYPQPTQIADVFMDLLRKKGAAINCRPVKLGGRG